MNIIFLDTETTNLPDFNLRARDPLQPHLVSLAMVVREHGSRDPHFVYNQIIRPDGWIIPPESSAIHGITTERASLEGAPERDAVEAFVKEMRQPALLVCHNVKFDKFIMRIAARRYDLITDADDAWWKAYPTFCTMRHMTDHCKLPGRYGYKWPTLQEAQVHAFGSADEKAHDALADVKACARLFDWLIANGAKAEGDPKPTLTRV